MKLIFNYHWDDPYVASGTETILFEYSSIEDFQLMVLEKIEEHRKECVEKYKNKYGYRYDYLTILDRSIRIEDLEDTILNSVFELDTWFEQNKILTK